MVRQKIEIRHILCTMLRFWKIFIKIPPKVKYIEYGYYNT